MEIERVEELDGGVGGVHGDVARDVEECLRVVEDDLDARVDQVVRRLLGARRGNREHADDDVVLAHCLAQAPVGLHLEAADRPSRLLGVGVEDDGDVDPVLCEDRGARDRLAEPAGADECDVVLPLGAEDLPDLAEQRVDVVPHPALAELAEAGEVAADLRRVDVRVVRDLLGRDPVLAHLPGLSQDLQVPGETCCYTDREAIRQRASFRRACDTAAHCADGSRRPRRRTVSTPSACGEAPLAGRST